MGNIDKYIQKAILLMKVVFFGKTRQPVYEFIVRLPLEDRAKILGCLKNVEDLGFNSPRVVFRQIQGKLWEIKIKSVSGGFRIFYSVMKEDTLILLHAYRKKSQKAPLKEIAVAMKRMLEAIKDESFYIK